MKCKLFIQYKDNYYFKKGDNPTFTGKSSEHYREFYIKLFYE